MLTLNKVKEELNLAYVLAVAASKKFSTEITRVDMDSVDATIGYSGYMVEGESTLYSPSVKLQLKATSHADIDGNFIKFPLPVKNYNDLRLRSATPRFLVILCLPELENEWLLHTDVNLILKNCAYYLDLSGEPETTNTTTITVKVPLANVFSPDTLYDLMLKTSKEEI